MFPNIHFSSTSLREAHPAEKFSEARIAAERLEREFQFDFHQRRTAGLKVLPQL
jgi:hypothetical protein